jgi:hypothetical protein
MAFQWHFHHFALVDSDLTPSPLNVRLLVLARIDHEAYE